MCSFAEFNRLKLDICTNLQKKHCIGEQILILLLDLLNSTYHIREMDFRDLPQIWNNLSKMCSFAEFNRPKLDICTNLQKKVLHWRANLFAGNGAPKLRSPYTVDGF